MYKITYFKYIIQYVFNNANLQYINQCKLIITNAYQINSMCQIYLRNYYTIKIVKTLDGVFGIRLYKRHMRKHQQETVQVL